MLHSKLSFLPGAAAASLKANAQQKIAGDKAGVARDKASQHDALQILTPKPVLPRD